jgi:hypothetical protein
MPVFEVITGPLPDDEALRFMPPYKGVPCPKPWDKNDVKYGNTRDPAKRQVKVEQDHERWKVRVAKYEADQKNGFPKYKAEFLKKAALSPLTGQVVAIGVCVGNLAEDCTIYRLPPDSCPVQPPWHEEVAEEAEIIELFWDRFTETKPTTYVSYDCFSFGLPFLVRRSMVLGVPVPPAVFQGGQYNSQAFHVWNNRWKDTKRIWQFGAVLQEGEVDIELEDLVKYLRQGAGPIDFKRSEFAGRYFEDPAGQAAALEYLIGNLMEQYDVTQSILVTLLGE